MNSILLFMGLGMQEMLLIGLVILIFFGARKIPEFMKGLGKGVREFKDGIKEVNKSSESSDTPATHNTSSTEKTNPPAATASTAKTTVDERRDLD